MENEMVRFTVQLTKQVDDEIKEICKSKGYKKSEVLRSGIDLFLDRERERRIKAQELKRIVAAN